MVDNHLQPSRPGPATTGACGTGATLRERAKHAAERWLAGSPFPGMLRARMAGGAVVLAYHNVVPRGEESAGDRSLHLEQDAFAAQLDLLRRTHDVVPLPELRVPARRGRPRAAITFDDAYRGAVAAGVEEVARLGLSATFFVVAGARAGERFWWDALAGRRGLPQAVRTFALDHLGGRRDEILRAVGRESGEGEDGSWLAGVPALPAHAAAAGDDELRAAAAVPGITLASHTLTHPDLTGMDGGEVREELEGSLAELRRRFGAAVIPWLSYPYGRWSSSVARAAREAGYEGALRVEGGPARGGDDPFSLPRINVPAGLSPEGFLLRTSGMEVERWRASW